MTLNYDFQLISNLEKADRFLYYGPDKLDDYINVPLKIFNKIFVIKKNGIYPRINYFKNLLLEELKLVDYSSSKIKNINYDLFAIIFSLVSRVEERSKKNERDRYGRFSINSDLMANQRLLSLAPVDHVMEALASIIFCEKKIQYRTSYNVVPTHDVDRLKSYHHPILPLRYAIGDLLKRSEPISAMNRLTDYLPGEPEQSFNFLMDQSEKYNIKSRFFFMGPSREKQDSSYCLRYPKILKRMAKSISRRGHIIGFHPGYLTYKDEKKWQEQKHGLEMLVNIKLEEGRQHMLQYDIEDTPQIWNNNKMIKDYTLSYPEEPGFRNGTSRPVVHYDLVKRKKMNLFSVATSIMDLGFLDGKYNNYNYKEALELCIPIINVCKKFNGTLVILMHTGRNFKKTKRFYSDLLKLAHEN